MMTEEQRADLGDESVDFPTMKSRGTVKVLRYSVFALQSFVLR